MRNWSVAKCFNIKVGKFPTVTRLEYHLSVVRREGEDCAVLSLPRLMSRSKDHSRISYRKELVCTCAVILDNDGRRISSEQAPPPGLFRSPFMKVASKSLLNSRRTNDVQSMFLREGAQISTRTRSARYRRESNAACQ
jgi:hypothetical protein